MYKDEEEHTFYGVSARVDYQKISIKITDCIRGKVSVSARDSKYRCFGR